MMIKQYMDKKGNKRLKSAILNLRIVSNDNDIANAILRRIQLQQFEAGESIISQGDTDTDVYFILSGSLKIFIKKREIATRIYGDHVGEMAAIDPHQKRSASCVAAEQTVCAKISERHFLKTANKFPEIWRRITIELANRLRERSKFVNEPNPIPCVFIGTSKESMSVGKKIKKNLNSKKREVKLWNKGIFDLSKTTIESLIAMVRKFDFGIVILNRDDVVISRGEKNFAPRDNVIFELGLLIGALGRERVIVLFPKGVNLKIPSDLLGVSFLDFTKTNLANKCSEISNIIEQLGPK